MSFDEKAAAFINEAKRIAKAVASAERIYVFTHIDADGISSGSIAYETARRLSIPVEIKFLKKLDDEATRLIREKTDGLVWMNDLGSGYISRFTGMNMVIADHHQPEPETPIAVDNGRVVLAESTIHHLNAHLFGIEGSTEICSSTTSYFISRSVSRKNIDLAPIAIVGAVGDLQDSRQGKLTGMNRLVLEDAVSEGLLKVVRDGRFYGKETRGMTKLLEYSVDPPIPGISNEPGGAERLLQSLRINYRSNGREMTWYEIEPEERRRIMSYIVERMIAEHMPANDINSVVGESYLIVANGGGTNGMPKDAKEFATLLNACGRYEHYDVGMGICLGDREQSLARALKLLENHRKNVANTIRLVREGGLEPMKRIQFFHVRDRAPDSIIGTIAGILMKSKDVDATRTIVGFAYSDGKVKVSARGNAELVSKGLNLSEAMRLAAENVGGVGGGHSIAAGATIDVGRETEFLSSLDDAIEEQMSRGSGSIT